MDLKVDLSKPRAFIIPLILLIGLVFQTFAVFTNYWGRAVQAGNGKFRFGLFEICSNECIKPDTNQSDSLAFGVIGFCFILFGFLFLLYTIAYRAKHQDITKAKFFNVLFFYTLVALLALLVNWTRFYEATYREGAVEDKNYISFGYSFGLVVTASVFTFIAVITTIAYQKVGDNMKFYLQLATTVFYGMALLFDVIGLYTHHWLVNNKSLITSTSTIGYFKACQEDICKMIHLNSVFAVELISLFTLCLLIVSVFYYNSYFIQFDSVNRPMYWLFIFGLAFFGVIMSITGWSIFLHFNKDGDIMFDSDFEYTYDWSFYFAVLASVILTVATAFIGYQIRSIDPDAENTVTQTDVPIQYKNTPQQVENSESPDKTETA